MSATHCQTCGDPIPDGARACPACNGSPGTRRRTGFRFETGDIIDNRYEVLERIPGGGMGELYKVRHLHLQDVRAIKILRNDQMNDSNYRERFLREARIAASIKHPNVALMHDFAALPDKSFYMVEEFIDGETLARKLRDGHRFSLNAIVEIARQVLLGLGAIHDKGIIHRDISPDNIMLAHSRDRGVRVKIIDLGIARSVDPSSAHSLTSAGIFIGKPHYASPEQMRLIEDDAPIDHRTDLYSLGVVLYEVVSGKVPFEASTPFDYLLRQLSGDFTAVDRCLADMVPPDLESFVVKLLRAKREERFQDTVAALLALSKIRVGADTIQDMPLDDADQDYPRSRPSQKRRQTAEVPIEQLRRLIEQDRPDSIREPVIPAQPQKDETADEFDDSQKITFVQTPTPPPMRTQDVPRPKMPSIEEDTVVRDPEPEPVAFVPRLPMEPPSPSEPEVPIAYAPPAEAAPPVVVSHASKGPNPLIWFVAGIAFVAVVSVGGYLLYRWLDANFGSAPEGSEQAAPVESSPTSNLPETASTGTTEGAGPTDALPPPKSADPEPVTASPVETAHSEASRTPPPAPEPARESEARSTPRTTPAPAPKPVPAATSEATIPATESPVEVSSEMSPDTVEDPPEQKPADAPVVLPGSTDDVREGDLVAPGPGVTGPVVLRTVEPIYPPLSSNMGREGVAMFSVLVGPDGKPEVVKLIISTGSEPLDKSAEDAARQTVFKPAMKNGVKVRMWKTIRFEFKKTRGL